MISINPNLEQNIAPTRYRASLILEKGHHHFVQSIQLRKTWNGGHTHYPSTAAGTAVERTKWFTGNPFEAILQPVTFPAVKHLSEAGKTKANAIYYIEEGIVAGIHHPRW